MQTHLINTSYHRRPFWKTVAPAVIVLLVTSMGLKVDAEETSSSENIVTPNANEIITKQRQMNTGFHDEHAHATLVLSNANGEKERELEFEFWQLEETDNSGAKSLVKIIKPEEVKGTGLFSFQNKKNPDDQWLYLPSSKKVTKLEGNVQTKSFLGSEFSYADFIPFDVKKFDYSFLKREACEDTQCYVVQWHPKFTAPFYLNVWIRSDNLQDVKIEYYSKAGKLQKTITLQQYRLINEKFWRPFSITVKSQINKRMSQIIIEETQLHNGLTYNTLYALFSDKNLK